MSKNKPLGVFQFGNKKLPKTTAIFNMTSALDCPSLALGYCQAIVDGRCVCYARPPEIQYPQVLPYRERQNTFWRSCVFYAGRFGATDFVRELIKSRKPSKIRHLRFNESGDFEEQRGVYLAFMIAHKLWKHHGIITYGYTARRDLDFSLFDTKFIRFMGSGFMSDGLFGNFQFVEKKEDVPDNGVVCKGDCNVCHRCWTAKNKTTYVVKHGKG